MDCNGEDELRTGYILALITALSGCSHYSSSADRQSSADSFFERLSSFCGKAYAGRLVSGEPVDAEMAGVPLVMHVRNCTGTEIRVPFHVGKPDGSWDRSRTWIISRTPTGLRLKHDHRHEDGSHDQVTMYGGDTATIGSIERQEFPVDQESIALFQREALARSITNIWAIEIVTDDSKRSPGFVYELKRVGENARLFRVAFDLSTPVDTPPPPWGQN
ncbi:MAG: hypothetical protein WBO17_13250 [Sphingorhabdus sp.]